MSESWPSHGPDFNRWYDDLPRFAALLAEAAGEGWWVGDTQLKYIGIRVDTRNGGFVLADQDGNRIDPDRVVAAIEKARAKFGRPKPPVT